MTTNGLDNNYEHVISPSESRAIRSAIQAFDRLWAQATPVTFEMIAEMYQRGEKKYNRERANLAVLDRLEGEIEVAEQHGIPYD